MRKLLTFDMHGADESAVLAVFNDQAEAWGVTEADIVSVQWREPAPVAQLAGMRGEGPTVRVRGTITYWAPLRH